VLELVQLTIAIAPAEQLADVPPPSKPLPMPMRAAELYHVWQSARDAEEGWEARGEDHESSALFAIRHVATASFELLIYNNYYNHIQSLRLQVWSSDVASGAIQKTPSTHVIL